MIYNERDLREAQALDIAQKMLVAARTAPKGTAMRRKLSRSPWKPSAKSAGMRSSFAMQDAFVRANA